MRKTKDVIGVGRDSERVYRITEMPALKAEKWALRALWGIAGAGVEIPDNISKTPFAKLVEIGLTAIANIPFQQAEPLLDEMLSCISIVMPDGKARARIADDFEEPMTILNLRKEVLDLHLSFFTENLPQNTEG
jgi:hypothetical protein